MKPEKRQKIMAAAEALLVKGRIHEITMDDVAQKAGVGKGTLYRYFPNKDALFAEIALSGFDELCAAIREEGRRTDDFSHGLANVSHRVREFHQRRRQLTHMMQNEERRALYRRGKSRAQWLARRQQLASAISEILERGQADGLIRPDIALELLAMTLLGLLRALGRAHADRTEALSDAQIIDLFLTGAGTGERAGK